MADVTTHSGVVRPDSMELLTKADRVPERLRRLENAAASGLLGGGDAGSAVVFGLNGWASPIAVTAGTWTFIPLPASGYTTEPSGAFTRNANGSLTIRDAGWYQMQVTGYLSGGTGSTGISIGTAASAEGGICEEFVSSGAVIAGVNAYYLPANTTIYVNAYASAASFSCQLRGFSVYKVGGPKGDKGDQGIQGPQGVKGDTGEQGPVGAQGIQGETGPPSAIAQPAEPTPRNDIYVWVDTNEPTPPYVVPGPPLVTNLPSNPVDGQEVHYLADATNGVIWHLRYRAAELGSYKWGFIGGSSLRDEQQAEETYSGTFPLTTWGGVNANDPTITVPLAGDYVVNQGARVFMDKTNACHIGVKIGATEPIYLTNSSGTTAGFANISVLPIQQITLIAVPAATVLAQRYYVSTNAVTSFKRGGAWLEVIPVRVG